MTTGFPPSAQGLYDPANEHDSCGVGFVANIKGKKSHTIIEQGLTILKNLTHRGAVGWDPKLSDGAGCLIQIPDKLYREDMAKRGVKLPPDFQSQARTDAPRAIADYIAGMTDRYAILEHRRLFAIEET